jgi:hypothetical protein
MRRKGYIAPQFGPPVPIIKNGDFSQFNFEREDIERAWEIIGPSVVRNLRLVRADQLWKVITFAYLEGLHHGSEIEKSR